MEEKIFILENLGCANCAAKMEKRINELEEVQQASITFATKQLRLHAKHSDELLKKIQDICSSIESEVIIKEKVRRRSQEEIAKEREEKKQEQKKDLICISFGAILFVLGEGLEHFGFSYTLPIFVLAYLLLGTTVLLTSLKHLGKGQIFDENFLMSLATVGAFAIQEYPEAVGVMLFYRIGEYFEERAVEKSRTQIIDAIDMRPETVNVLVNGRTQVLPAEAVKLDDILLVRPGDRIPLDGVIIEGESRLDTSPLTGEPVPVQAGVNKQVLSGCINLSGVLKIKVQKTLEDSMVTRILDSVENAAASKPKADRFITKFARIYTPIVVFLALGTMILPPLLLDGNWNYWIYTALSFLVMSCPCALVLSVPLAFFSGIGAGSKKGILFKGGAALERLASVKAIIMDKTGTITKGEFVVQQLLPSENFNKEELLTLAASCEQHSSHPIAQSIVQEAKKQGIVWKKPSTTKELAGKGLLAILDGKVVLCGNQKLMEQHLVKLPELPSSAYGTEVLLAVEGVYIGRILISDTIKADAVSSIKSLKQQGLKTVMLTGDAAESANAIAKETGVEEVYARLLPQDKLETLQKLRKDYQAVMFVGDGINDAPVLAGADVGAAMGSGADAAIEAADLVFMTSNMEAIPQALSLAKEAVRISWQNIIFALAVKIFVMILGLCGFASMWMAVFADSGVAMLCVLNSIRILYKNPR